MSFDAMGAKTAKLMAGSTLYDGSGRAMVSFFPSNFSLFFFVLSCHYYIGTGTIIVGQ